jgi:hypothetical protein
MSIDSSSSIICIELYLFWTEDETETPAEECLLLYPPNVNKQKAQEFRKG